MTNISIGIATVSFLDLEKAIKAIDKTPASGIHFDIMDGVFTKDITYGAKLLRNLRPLTTKPFDAHLMVQNPLPMIKDFAEVADRIFIHPESFPSPREGGVRALEKTIKEILKYKRQAGIVLSEHSCEGGNPLLPKNISAVIVMTAKLGAAAQKFNPPALKKIKEIRANYPSVEILVDGGMNYETAARAVQSGADTIISGSFIMSQSNLKKAVASFRSISSYLE